MQCFFQVVSVLFGNLSQMGKCLCHFSFHYNQILLYISLQFSEVHLEKAVLCQVYIHDDINAFRCWCLRLNEKQVDGHTHTRGSV
jgi:hypothetical protein